MIVKLSSTILILMALRLQLPGPNSSLHALQSPLIPVISGIMS
jgi:hypothetical protein